MAMHDPTPPAAVRIYVDADACPRDCKDLLYRHAERRRLHLTLVANRPLRVPTSPWIHTLQVESGFDIADERIADLVSPGDLVITADIPLAKAVIDRGGVALAPRGTLYTAENIGPRAAVRDILTDLRATGIDTAGPPAFTPQDRQAFANALDKYLTRATRPSP